MLLSWSHSIIRMWVSREHMCRHLSLRISVSRFQVVEKKIFWGNQALQYSFLMLRSEKPAAIERMP